MIRFVEAGEGGGEQGGEGSLDLVEMGEGEGGEGWPREDGRKRRRMRKRRGVVLQRQEKKERGDHVKMGGRGIF